MMRLASGQITSRNLEILDPEQYLYRDFRFQIESSKCVPWLLKEVEEKRAEIQHAYLFEAKMNGAGRMLKEVEGRKSPYKISKVYGTEAFHKALRRGDNAQNQLKEAFRKQKGKLKENWDGDGWGGSQNGPYDPNQYTEFAPITGGYFACTAVYFTICSKRNGLQLRGLEPQPTGKTNHRWHGAVHAWPKIRLASKSKIKRLQQNRNKRREEVLPPISISASDFLSYWIREKLIFGELFLNFQRRSIIVFVQR